MKSNSFWINASFSSPASHPLDKGSGTKQKGKDTTRVSLPQHAGIVSRVVEKRGPEPEQVFLLADAVLREAEVNWLLQVAVLPCPIPDESKAC